MGSVQSELLCSSRGLIQDVTAISYKDVKAKFLFAGFVGVVHI